MDKKTQALVEQYARSLVEVALNKTPCQQSKKK